MTLLAAPATALAWLGRQGTRAIAALVVIGIAFPALGAVFQPHLAAAVFVLLCLAFLRVDLAAARSHLRRPGVVLAAGAWTSLVVPVLFGVCGRAAGLDVRSPELFLALMLQAVASPMMAAPALAALMGLDATLALVTLIVSTALVPLTAPLFVRMFVGSQLSIAPLALAGRLFAMLAGAGVVGLGARRLLGPASVERHRERIDGINVIVLFVFVAAVLGGVGPRFVAAPGATLALAALAFGVYLAVLLVTALVFRAAGPERSLALALLTAQRNLGLMMAVSGRALPDLAWAYFALSQFPIYLSPHLLQPLARRALARGVGPFLKT